MVRSHPVPANLTGAPRLPTLPPWYHQRHNTQACDGPLFIPMGWLGFFWLRLKLRQPHLPGCFVPTSVEPGQLGDGMGASRSSGASGAPPTNHPSSPRSQNHNLVWVGRDTKDHLVPPTAMGRGIPSTRPGCPKLHALPRGQDGGLPPRPRAGHPPRGRVGLGPAPWGRAGPPGGAQG